MQPNLRPWVTAGIALAGASLIAVTPVTPPPSPGAQHRSVHLTSYEEFSLAQLLSTTEANFAGLQTALSSSNWLTNPDIPQGFSTLFSDLSTGTANPVTNPFSLLIEGALTALSTGYATNAASTAATAVFDNIQSALSSGDSAAALTDLENAPTTILYGFLNGYPTSIGSDLLSPQFGLLTNTVNGAATGSIDAWQQVSNTLADEVANIGGANLPTGPLPLVSGNLDLSVNLNQILSDLGLTSGGGPLTINQLLADLHLPSSITIGQVLSLLHVSDNSGFTIGQILGLLHLSDSSGVTVGDVLNALNLTDSSGITLGQALNDLGLTGSSGISIGQILGDLGFSDTTSISIPPISVGTILGDLGLSDTSSISIPPISVGTILADLGYSDSTSIPISNISIPITQILQDLGVTNTSGDLTFNVPGISVPVTTILSDLGINPGGSVSIPISITVFGQHINQNVSVAVSTILNAFGINTGGSIGFNVPPISIPITTILQDLGITNTSGDLTFGVPPISIGDVLNFLGLSDTNTITPPAINIGDVLNFLGLSDTSTITPPAISIGDVLNFLNLNDSSSLDLSQILSALGLSSSDTITIGNVLNFLGLNDTSQAINIGQILNVFGLNDNSQAINIGDVLNFLGLNDNSSISFDSILNALGINPNEDIFSLLGISNPLTLSPTIDLTGGSVQAFDLALAQDLMAVLGSFAQLSSDLPSLLTTDPTLNIEPLLSNLLSDLGLPATITGGTLTADLTNIVAELMPNLVP